MPEELVFNKCTTPKEYLLEVKRLILEEPKRINMQISRTLDENAAKHWGKSGVPNCGMVCCIGGWLTVIHPEWRGGTTEWAYGKIQYWTDVYVFTQRALQTLNITRLVHVPYWPMHFQLALKGLTPGSPAYARVVAERIDSFIEERWPDTASSADKEE